MTLNKCNCWVASIVLLYAISVSNASAFGLNNSFPRDLGSHVSGQTVDSMDGVMCVFSSAGGVSTLSKYVGATSVVGLIGEEEASAITTGLKRIIKTTKETFGESFQMFKFLDELKLFKDLELLKFLKIEARIDPGIIEEIVKGVSRFEKVTVQHRLQFNKLLEYFNSDSDLQILHEAVGDIDDYEDIVIGTEKALGQGDLSRVAGGAINDEEKLKQAECLRDLGAITPKENKLPGEITQADLIQQSGSDSNEVVDWSSNIIEAPGSEEIIQDLATQTSLSNLRGTIGEVQVSSIIKSKGSELLELRKTGTVDYFDPVVNDWRYDWEYEVEIVHRTSDQKVILNEVKTGDLNRPDSLTNKLKSQLARDDALVKPKGDADKARLISKGTVSDEIKKFISDNQYNIEIVEGFENVV